MSSGDDETDDDGVGLIMCPANVMLLLLPEHSILSANI